MPLGYGFEIVRCCNSRWGSWTFTLHWCALCFGQDGGRETAWKSQSNCDVCNP